MHSMESGQVYCPRLINAILLCIVTGKNTTAGSRVRIDEIELNGNRYTGPGNVTDALGITVAKDTGTAHFNDPVQVRIDLSQQPQRRQPTTKKKKRRQETPLSNRAWARLMPLITDRYIAEDPSITFDNYLNALLRECKTETALRKRVTN